MRAKFTKSKTEQVRGEKNNWKRGVQAFWLIAMPCFVHPFSKNQYWALLMSYFQTGCSNWF